MSFFSFLGKVANTVGHDVSTVAHGNSAPGGGVFGFLQGVQHQGADLIRTDINNPVRELAAQATNNPVALHNANLAQQQSIQSVAPLVHGITRSAPEVAQTILHPFSQSSYTPGSPLEQGLFGSTPVQNIQAKVATNYQDHPGLNPILRVGLAGAEGAASVAQDAPVFRFLGNAAKTGTELASPTLKAGANQFATANEIGAIGKDVVPKPEDIHIPTNAGTIRISPDELNNLTKAQTPEAVKSIIGDALPQEITDRIAPGLALAKDPNIIQNIISKGVNDTLPRPPAPVVGNEIAPPSVSEPVNPAGQGTSAIQPLIDIVKQSPDLKTFEAKFKALPDNPQLAAAVDKLNPTSIEDLYTKAGGVVNANVNPDLRRALDSATKPTGTGGLTVDLGDNAKTAARSIRTAFSGEKNRQVLAGNQLADVIKKIPDTQDALFWYREAKGNPGKLQSWLEDNSGKLDPYKQDIQDALHLSPEGKQASSALDEFYNKAGYNAVEQGTLKQVLHDYNNPRLYVQESNPQGLGGLVKQTTQLSKQRKYENIAEAIRNDHIPATTNAADLLSIHNAELSRVNTTRNLLDNMKDAKLGQWVAPGNIPKGFSQVGNLTRTGSFITKEGTAASSAKVFIAPTELANRLRAITDPNLLGRLDKWRSLQKYQGLVKTVDLSYSLFHHITFAAQALYQTKLGFDVVKNLPKIMGTDTADFAEAEQNFAKYGGVTTKVDDIQDIMRKLYNPGDNTAIGKFTNAPLIKQFLQGAHASSGFLFDKMQRFLKVNDWTTKTTNWLDKHPNATEEEFTKAAQGFAKEVNSAYGGLNWEAMGVTKTQQATYRTILLAPDWVISNLSLAKYATGGGTEGQAARQHLFTAFTSATLATQALNKAITGHFTNENPKGHQWEIQIAPNVYVSLYRGGLGELVKLQSNIINKGFAQGIAQYGQGKLAPVPRTVVGLASGTQFTGQPINNKNDNFLQKTVGEAKYIATSASPVPFGASAATKYANQQIKDKASISPGVAASLATGVSRFTKSSNSLSSNQQTYVNNLQKQGAPKEQIDAVNNFILTTKKVAPDQTKADKQIKEALSKDPPDIQGALQAAEQYNQKLSDTIQPWNDKYGQYANADIQKYYDGLKIKLDSSSIRSRIKSISSPKL